MRIVVIAPKEPAVFFDLLWQGVWEATFDIAQFGVEVTDVTPPQYDLEAQRTILADLLPEHVDAIAIVPQHVSALNDLIGRHVAKGTSVVTFHNDAPESGRTLFVGPDAFRSGVLAGEMLAQLMGGCGKVISFPGLFDEHQLAQRYNGLRVELQRHPGISEVCAAGIDDLGSSVESIQGIYIGSTDQTVVVGQALQQCGLRVPCLGFTKTEEVEPLVKGGVLWAIIDDRPHQQGYFAVQRAYEAALRRGGPAPPGLRIAGEVILASNINDAGAGQSLHEAYESLILQRTADLTAHQKMLQEANGKLENLAHTDALTGLFNRRRFEEALKYEVDRARRYGTLSLLMIDLNWFKQINDQYGHKAGDEALKAVAQNLKSRCRTTDICARLGGDEFAVILPQTALEGAAVVRQSILDLIEQTRLPWQGQDLELSLSIGVATLSSRTADPEGLMAEADASMYRHKAALKANRASSTSSIGAPSDTPACRIGER